MTFFHKLNVKQVHLIILIVLSLIINLFFLSFNLGYKNFYSGLISAHGEIGCNFYKYNSIKLNPKQSGYVSSFSKEGELVDYGVVKNKDFGKPTIFRDVNDTIGYGVLLGLIWKITGSLKYRDVQILQVIIFSFLMILFYFIVYMIFASYNFAFLCSCLLLCFYPLIYLNVQPLRDIWGYYGLIILLFALLRFFKFNMRMGWLIICGIFFALCQYIRPTIFFNLLLILPVFGYFFRNEKIKLLKAFSVFFVSNLLFFWVPFMTYNKIAYNHYFVSCSGHGLLAGLGQFKNKWEIKLDDGSVASVVHRQFGFKGGTVDYNKGAKKIFYEYVKDDPIYFCKTILYRFPSLFVLTVIV